ncbi:hypothetical protein [Streptomyces sp. enrichment culture]|uniref:hypothetical protein n=1 Tax=Streptomyces sp. enrichment culture TaxID=1795815 RepID=UPI003F5784ED
MHDLIRRIAQRLALLFGPGSGTHRAGARRLPRPEPRATRRPAGTLLPRSPYCTHPPLDGTASRLVRPYLAVHEHAQEQERQRHRRLALVLAADFGIDLDQHIVGAEQRTVAA